jgi:CRP-like cAMP-binding protein
LIKISARFPRLADRFWFSTLLDGAIHRQWTFQLGRSGSEKRIAHLFCELYTRLEMVGLTIDGTFALPLTQHDLAEAAGLTAVHVNRVLRDLREGGVPFLKSKTAHVLDFAKLAKIAEFDPAYLYRSS